MDTQISYCTMYIVYMPKTKICTFTYCRVPETKIQYIQYSRMSRWLIGPSFILLMTWPLRKESNPPTWTFRISCDQLPFTYRNLLTFLGRNLQLKRGTLCVWTSGKLKSCCAFSSGYRQIQGRCEGQGGLEGWVLYLYAPSPLYPQLHVSYLYEGLGWF